MTSDEIRNPRFYTMGRGAYYKVSEVDEYVEKVADSYDRLLNERFSFEKERQELFAKMNVLAQKIEEYRLDEDNIKITLLKAQRMADKTVKQALAEAQSIRDEAEEKVRADSQAAKAEVDEYAAEVTAGAEEYLRKTKTDYEEKLASLEVRAQQIIAEANGKAEYIISDAKIRSAAALEKANEQLSSLRESCESLTRLTQKNLNDMKSQALAYKNEMVKLISKQAQAVEETVFPDYAAPSSEAEMFSRVRSEIGEQVSFVAQEPDEPVTVTAVEQEPDEEPETVVDEPETVVGEPETEPEAVIEEPEVAAAEEPETAVAEEPEAQKPEDEPVQLPKKDISDTSEIKYTFSDKDFVNISSSDEDEPDEAASDSGEILSYEQAQAQPDLLELLSQRAQQEAEEDEDISESAQLDEEPEEEPDEDDGYAQPSLFETTKRGEALKQRMNRFLADGGDADVEQAVQKPVDNGSEPLKFGTEFDIFSDDSDDDVFFDKHKKNK